MEFSQTETDAEVAGGADRRLGRYELVGTLGAGGMATVYLGLTTGEGGFQRLFAIKVLHHYLMSEPQFIEMFLDEARIAAALRHPNVVPIVDLGTHDGAYYVAMEYVEGCSLATLLNKHARERPPRLLVPLMLDALAGLEAAHAAVDDAGQPMRLVHRDVSPQNILIGVDGTARLTDFGIARASTRVNTTQPGSVKGKYAYMSPEQFGNSAELDQRADIFSAGSVLWSMLTARRLFQADHDAATIHNIMKLEVPAPSRIGLRPPGVFDAVCLRALERDPAQRFATAQAMEDALREAAARAGGLASRREIAAWVVETMAAELAATRAAIRGAALGPGRRPSHVRIHGTSSVTSSSGASGAAGRARAPSPADGCGDAGIDLDDAEPGEALGRGSADVPAAAASRWRRVAAVGAGSVLCTIIAGVLWMMLRAPEPTAVRIPRLAPAGPVLPSGETGFRPATAAAPSPAPRVSVPAPAPSPAPRVSVPAPAPPMSTEVLAAPVPAVEAVLPRAAPAHSRLPAPPRAAPAPRRKPAATVPPPPPPPPADRPAAPPEPSTRAWDKDSPVPPP